MTIAAALALLGARALSIDPAIFAEDGVSDRHDVVAVMAWPAGTHLTLHQTGAELVIRSDRPVIESSIRQFADVASLQIEDLRWNDNTVLLRAVSIPTAVVRADSVELTLPATVEGVASAGNDDARQATRAAAMTAIAVELAAGYPTNARRLAQGALAGAPRDRELLRLLADAETAEANIGAAARHYREAGADDHSARQVIARAGGIIGAESLFRSGSHLTQVDSRATLETPVSDRVRLKLGVRQVIENASSGNSSLVTGAYTAEVSASWRAAPLLQIDFSGASWIDEGVTGGGARVTWGSPQAQLFVAYSAGLPDFSIAGQIRNRGYLNQLRLGAGSRLTSGLSWRLEGGLRTYGLRNLATAQTLSVEGGLDLVVLRRPTVTLAYRFDGEYVSADRANGAAALLALADRENHSVLVYIDGRAGPVGLTAGAGWTVNRYGGEGPNLSLAAALPVGDRWLVEASSGLSSISRPGFPGRQVFGRLGLRRSLGDLP
ncbi:hypothetical protein [Novosphingobium cyanobacteriorum]|uniref:Uncharacterized protein n=1 Tax=Novosphingobium cyanobacteriorum TaxID=3024215 RepID=A0ABT6CNP0_9SPHN|nr:hypothetical protein [Novosphingobium cyanobacteriorum]MDF8335534.1 hypothetical protein [Novosphingobium cyanobacteriorum]